MFTFSLFVDSRPFYISFSLHLRCVFGVKTETHLRNFLVGSAKIDRQVTTTIGPKTLF